MRLLLTLQYRATCRAADPRFRDDEHTHRPRRSYVRVCEHPGGNTDLTKRNRRKKTKKSETRAVKAAWVLCYMPDFVTVT